MVRKIYAYGNPVLKKEGDWIEEDHEGLDKIMEDMMDTMSAANGIGLAAQQIGLPLKIFVLDLSHHEEYKDIKGVFINSEIIEESEETCDYEEGCLSFPGISVNVTRPAKVKVYYQDEDFNEHEEWIDGIYATAFQHEHDHTEGVVFTDHTSPLKKQLLKGKLNKIKRGDITSNRYQLKHK